jgi:hypothetical protein
VEGNDSDEGETPSAEDTGGDTSNRSRNYLRSERFISKLTDSNRPYPENFGPMVHREGLRGIGLKALADKNVIAEYREQKDREKAELGQYDAAADACRNRPNKAFENAQAAKSETTKLDFQEEYTEVQKEKERAKKRRLEA